MSQLTAGEVIDLELNGVRLTVKIEDASKSDVFLAKVQQVNPENTLYHVDQVVEFNRNVI